jgi:hypothetical protein
MKFLSTYTARPGCLPEVMRRFLAGEAKPMEGVTLLGRWHKTDLSGGFSLNETDDPTKLYEFALKWSDVLEIHSNLVIEDAEAGPIIAKLFAK